MKSGREGRKWYWKSHGQSGREGKSGWREETELYCDGVTCSPEEAELFEYCIPEFYAAHLLKGKLGYKSGLKLAPSRGKIYNWLLKATWTEYCR